MATEHTANNEDVKESLVLHEHSRNNHTAETSDLKKFSNSYASKKTIAESVLNVALIMANVSQLKVLLTTEPRERTMFFVPMLVLLSLSLLLQVITAVVLVILGAMKKSTPSAKKLNNTSLLLISIVTFLNLLISGLFDT